MAPTIIAEIIDIGRDTYGRTVTATRKRTYDGKTVWEIVSAPVSQRDDGERMSGLSDENLRALAQSLALVKGPDQK